MQKIKDYIDRFFKSKEINRKYALTTDELIVFTKEMQYADVDGLFNAVRGLFKYGYVKGYRAAQAEIKKGGATDGRN